VLRWVGHVAWMKIINVHKSSNGKKLWEATSLGMEGGMGR